MSIEGTLFWVMPDPAGGNAAVDAVAAELDLRVRFCSYGEVFDALRNELCQLIGLEMGKDPEQTFALVRELHERLPRITVLVAGRDISVPTMRAAFSAGASDLLSLPLEAHELHKAVLKFTHQRNQHAAQHNVAGEIITLCGARGGLGVTTLAVNLAVRLHALTNSKVALVDLDLQRGDAATFLNLTPTQSMAAIAAASGDVDELFLHSTLTRHPSGISLLAAPPNIEDADTIGADDVSLALHLLRGRFRYTVVDTSRFITTVTLAAVAEADQILVLMDLSVPGVRSARRILELLARLKMPAQRVELLLTHTGPGMVPLDDGVRALGKQPLLTIPRDQAAATNAMNTGAPLNGAKPSVLALAIDELARKLTGIQPEGDAKRGTLLRRFFNKGARP